MALLLYTIVGALLLGLTHRFVLPLTRTTAAVLFLLPFLLAGHALITSGVYGPVDHAWDFVPLNWMKADYGVGAAHNGYLSDVSTQMIPWRAAVRSSLLNGELPLWNRFILGGDILAAAGQPAAWSPFTLLACLLPAPLSLTFSAAIAHLVAAAGAFVLARELGCREAAALIAAAGFTYATSIALFILWPLGAAWALAPFVLAAVHRRSLPLLTVAFTLLLLSGHPETVLHVVFLAGGWALVVVPPRALPRLALAGILALLLSAIDLLPLLEAVPQAMEAEARSTIHANILRGAPAPEMLARMATDVFPSLHTRRWQVPGVPEELPVDTSAAGSIVLALALYAAIRVRSRATWFFAALAIFGFLAHSGWIPLARALQKLPLFDQALNERFSFAAALSLAILAAIGVEELLRRERDRVAAITFVLVLLALAAGNFWIAQAKLVTDAPPVWGRFTTIAELAGLAVAAILAFLRMPRLLLVTLLAQRLVTTGDIYRTHEQRIAYPPIPMLEPLKTVREPFRITGHGLAFIPGTSALYGLEDMRGNQALTFGRTAETFPLWCVHQPVWFNRVDDLTRPFLSFLNVRYAITWDRDPPPPGWREVSRQRGAMLIENTRALPRVFVPRSVRIGPNALQEMVHETDFAARAWIEADSPLPERPNGPGSVVTRDAYLGYELDADMAADGWIVASLPRWKGWRAYVDGRRAPTHFANHAFLGLHVPRGRHRVRLLYLPDSFLAGAGITLLTLLSCGAIPLVRRARARS